MSGDILTECVCEHPGQDDGQYTCWVHHDCSDGSCTHTDDGEEDRFTAAQLTSQEDEYYD